jgi:hypothetical protein
VWAKKRADVSDELSSAHRSHDLRTNALRTGYFGYLATFYFKLQFGPLEGGHIGSGPPSGAGTLGAAAATYVLTNASIRNNALIRFIGFSPYTQVTNLQVTNVRPHYNAQVKCPN